MIVLASVVLNGILREYSQKLEVGMGMSASWTQFGQQQQQSHFFVINIKENDDNKLQDLRGGARPTTDIGSAELPGTGTAVAADDGKGDKLNAGVGL